MSAVVILLEAATVGLVAAALFEGLLYVIYGTRQKMDPDHFGKLQARHDALRAALETLVAMHRGGPNEGVGNWDWAFEQAEKALEETK